MIKTALSIFLLLISYGSFAQVKPRSYVAHPRMLV